MDKKVSVIVAFYNEEKYIKDSVNSILSQDYDNIELILVNDGSTDNSEKIVQEFNDKRIKYISYFPNRRHSYARNRGLEIATGDYICFFDADDIMEEDSVSSRIKFLEMNPEIGVVDGGKTYIDKDGKEYINKYKPVFKSDNEIKPELLFHNCIAMGGGMFRSRVVEEGCRLDENAFVAGDYIFWLELSIKERFACIDKPIYKYRINHCSQTQRIQNEKREEYEKLLRTILSNGWKNRGYNLNTKDIYFLYNFLFKRQYLRNASNVLYCFKLYNKIKKQSDNDLLGYGREVLKRYRYHAIDCTFFGRSVMWIWKRVKI